MGTSKSENAVELMFDREDNCSPETIALWFGGVNMLQVVNIVEETIKNIY